jgi:tetratricopeptide (TPR) repeat protein
MDEISTRKKRECPEGGNTNTNENDNDNGDDHNDEVAITMTTTSPATATAEEMALEWKDKGNVFYSQKNLDEALEAYKTGLNFLEEEELQQQQQTSSTSDLAIALRSNVALVLLKLQHYPQAEQECTKVVELDPSNSKGRNNMT